MPKPIDGIPITVKPPRRIIVTGPPEPPKPPKPPGPEPPIQVHPPGTQPGPVYPPVDDTPIDVAKDWSDGYIVLQVNDGIFIQNSYGRGVPSRVLSIAPADLNQNWINSEVLRLLRLPNTTTEPWPPPRTSAGKASAAALLAESSQPTNSDLLRYLERILDVVTEKVSPDPNTPPVPPPMPKDVWANAFESSAPEPGEPLKDFDAVRAALYAVHGLSPLNGVQLTLDPRKLAAAKAIYYGTAEDEAIAKAASKYANLCSHWNVATDVMYLALLAGGMEIFDSSFNARLDVHVADLAGRNKLDQMSDGSSRSRFVPWTFETYFLDLFPHVGGSAGIAES